MKKAIVVVMMLFLLSGCSASNDDSHEATNEQENLYESDYTDYQSFQYPALNELYYNYHIYYGGIYLIDGDMQVNVTEDCPEAILNQLETNSSLTVHKVKFSSAELYAVREVITRSFSTYPGMSSMGTSQKDNCVHLGLLTDSEIPVELEHYIEIGMIVIEFMEEGTYVVATNE